MSEPGAQPGGGEDDDFEIDGDVLADLDGQGEDGAADDVDEGSDMEAEEGDGNQEDDVGNSSRVPMDDDSIHVFEGHTDAVLAVAWNPAQHDMVATGGQDDVAYLWRVGQDAFESTAGTLSTHELTGHTDSVASLAFNSKGTLLATGGMEGCVKVWNTETGSIVQTLEGPGGSVDWVAWHPKGDVVLAGSEDFTLWMWLAQSGSCMQVFAGHNGPVTSGRFTHDGKAVVSTGGEDDCALRVWNPKTGECLHNIQGHGFHEAGITSCSVHSDSATVLTGAEDGSVKVSNIAIGKVIGTLTGHEESVEAVGLSEHLPMAGTAGVDGKLLIWDLNLLKQRGLGEHPDAVTRMVWHPTQPLAFTACTDGIVRCWDIRTAKAVKQFGGHGAAVQDLALSPDASMIITGSDDKTARIFVFAS